MRRCPMKKMKKGRCVSVSGASFVAHARVSPTQPKTRFSCASMGMNQGFKRSIFMLYLPKLSSEFVLHRLEKVFFYRFLNFNYKNLVNTR
jgi:hypothetical protein